MHIKDIVKMDLFSQFKLHLREYLDQQSSMMQPVGGMDHIIHEMAATVTKNIQTNAQVTSIKREDSSAIVTYMQNGQESAVSADNVIVAMPPKSKLNVHEQYFDRLTE